MRLVPNLYRINRSHLYTTMCNTSKRVEGNAGQILDEAPKNKPYNTVKTVFFSVFKPVVFL